MQSNQNVEENNEVNNEKRLSIANLSMMNKIQQYEKFDYMFRICIIGDSSVGKTSLLTRYCDNVFKESYNNTIGVDFRVFSLKYNDTVCKVHIWDTAGQERFKSVAVNYFKSTHGFMFVYDVTNKSSFDNINKWAELVHNTNQNAKVNFLIGNKCDLNSQRQIKQAEAKEFSDIRQYNFMETSAKTCENVGKAFEYFAYQLIDYYKKNQNVYDNEKEKEKDNLKLETSSERLSTKGKPVFRNPKKSKCNC